MGLAHISLVVNDAEHFFQVLIGHCIAFCKPLKFLAYFLKSGLFIF